MSAKQRKPRTKKFNGPIEPPEHIKTENQAEGRNDGEGEETMEDKFERELHWCIEQLSLGLETKRPDSKQALEAIKVMKILQSEKTPLIKKRQVMRNTFGDYRQKMKAQEKKSAAKMRKLEFTSGETSASAGKSVFYRKRKCAETTLETTPANDNHDYHMTGSENEKEASSLDDGFRFKFQQTEKQFEFNFNISSKDSDGTTDSNECDIVCKSSTETAQQTAQESAQDDVCITKAQNACDTRPVVSSCFVTDTIHNYFVAQQGKGVGDFKFNFSVT